MTTPALAQRCSAIKPSPTLAISARAKAMRAEGADVISLSAGEPDFNTPEPIREAAIKAMNDGHTKYTPTAGIPELRDAVAEKLEAQNGIRASREEVIVTCGAKQAIFNALMALLEPGDEVLLIAPFWPTYADQVIVAGGAPITTSLETLELDATARTKAIIVNSPCNPSGGVLSREQLKRIAAFALKRGLWVISDEIYEDLIYEGEHQSIAALGKEIAERTVTVTGCSKSYAMTGWRIGFAHAPEPLAKAMCAYQDQETSNAASFAQYGALAAVQGGKGLVAPMLESFRKRRELILGLLDSIEGVETDRPGGAFYVFPNVSAFADDDFALAESLLTEAHVAVVPGSAFCAPGHLRISYAASEGDIQEGVSRIAVALSNMRT